ncbi:MAG: T9SS type A sorting domain-containing protein [Bacteroidia bacterium]|jgi:hypothetical protein
MNKNLRFILYCLASLAVAQIKAQPQFSVPTTLKDLTYTNLSKHAFYKAGNGILDSSRQYKFDSLEMRWKWFGTKLIYAYDSDANKTIVHSQNWNDTSSGGQSRLLFTYDNNRNILSETTQHWIAGIWENYSQHVYAYNSNNDITQDYFHLWNSPDWEERSRAVYAYNDSFNIITIVYETKDSGIWERITLDSFVYDSSHQLIQQFDLRWYENKLISGEHFYYTYDSLKRGVVRLIQRLDGILWENSVQWLYTYDSGNMNITEIRQNWKDNAWENINQIQYILNVNQKITQEVKQLWDGVNWVNKSRRKILYNGLQQKTMDYLSTWYDNKWNSDEEKTYEYDNNGNEIHYLKKVWDSNKLTWYKYATEDKIFDSGNNLLSHQTWVNSSPNAPVFKTLYYYRGFPSGMDDVAKQGNTFMLYPNPTRDWLNISTGTYGENIQVKLFSMIGQLILEREIKYNNAYMLNLSDVQPGLYMIEVRQSKLLQNGKFIRE